MVGIDKSVILELEISKLVSDLSDAENVHGVVFDGVITQRLLDIAAAKKIEYIIGAVSGEITRKPAKIKVYAAG